jgi:hypothetical protein
VTLDETVINPESTMSRPARDLRGFERWVAAATAQAIGVLLLATLIFWIFPIGAGDPTLNTGLEFLKTVTQWLFLASIFVFALCPVFNFFRVRKKKTKCVFSHTAADVAIWSAVGADIAALTLLVCQQGGLCQSMLVPLFFLIPAAYLYVERPGRWRAEILVLACIVVGIAVSHHYTSHASQTSPALWLGRPVSNFHLAAREAYDKGVFVVCLFSIVIMAVEIIVGPVLEVIQRHTSATPLAHAGHAF